MKKRESDEKYIKRMKKQGFMKSCVWIPKNKGSVLKAFAKGLRIMAGEQ